MKLLSPSFRICRALTGVGLLLALAGCTSRIHNGMPLITEGKIKIEFANFKSGTVHAVGRAHCDCVFWLVVSGPSEIKNAAWRAMKKQAGQEGTAGHFVNVTIEQSWRWVFYPFYWQEHYVVSADTVVFTGSLPVDAPPDDSDD